MSGWRRLLGARGAAKGDELEGTEAAQSRDRGLPRVQRPSSMTSRLTQLLAFAIVALIGAGVLGWYYASAASRPELERVRAEKSAREKAAGEQVLPKLPTFEMPKYFVPPAVPAAANEAGAAAETLESSGEGHENDELDVSTVQAPAAPTLIYRSQASPPESPTELPPVEDPIAKALARQLGGNVFTPRAENALREEESELGTPRAESHADLGALRVAASGADAGVVKARSRGSMTMQIPKGAVIECTLLTAIDSQLPGLTTCVSASDVFGADGDVVLLERGTQLVGEASAELKAGQTRVRVIWHEARTPKGIAVNLDSPGTDALGRAGVAGVVDRRFAERFGAAILMSVIDGAIQVAVESQRKAGGSNVVVSSGASGDIATEALKETVGIPPRILVAQGARVAVLVTKDVDFQDVYAMVRMSTKQ